MIPHTAILLTLGAGFAVSVGLLMLRQRSLRRVCQQQGHDLESATMNDDDTWTCQRCGEDCDEDGQPWTAGVR